MQEKVVFDTNVYIGVFNQGLYKNEINGFNKIMYLVHPVLHELWIGAREKREINHLINFGTKFIQSGRLVVPSSATQVLIGRVCQKYNDVSIALLARQIGAVVVTTNISDFKKIHQVVDFKFRKVM